MLSIIVPVYNVEKYLNECLISIQKQNYQDYEVIIINDGSTDSSLEIASKFCETDSRFKVYTKKNGGLSDARNYGLQYATKKYLTFLDSDDKLAQNTYEEMMNKIINEDLDIVLADIEYFFEDNTNGFVLKGLKQISEKDMSKKALLSPMFAWNKIYKLEYFKSIDLLYPLGLWYEDIPVTTALFVNTSKIGYVNYIGYYYRQRTSSIMGQRSNKVKDIFIILNSVLAYLKKHNLLDKYYEEIEYLCIEQIMLYGQYRFLVSDDYKDLFENSINFMNTNFKNYKKNKYLNNLSLKNKLFINTLNKMSLSIYRLYLKR